MNKLKILFSALSVMTLMCFAILTSLGTSQLLVNESTAYQIQDLQNEIANVTCLNISSDPIFNNGIVVSNKKMLMQFQ